MLALRSRHLLANNKRQTLTERHLLASNKMLALRSRHLLAGRRESRFTSASYDRSTGR